MALSLISVSRGGQVHIILWAYVCPSICFKPTRFHGEISPHFGTDLYFTEIYKRTVLISQCSGFFLKGACMYVLLRVRTNFKADLISFPMYIIPLSRLSQWLTILSQQLHLCPE